MSDNSNTIKIPIRSPKTCQILKTCPAKYTRKEIANIATQCGIDLKRGQNHKSPGTLKNINELCEEIVAVTKGKNSPEEVVSLAKDITDEVTDAFEDNQELKYVYERLFLFNKLSTLSEEVQSIVSDAQKYPEYSYQMLEEFLTNFRKSLHTAIEMLSLRGEIDRAIDRETRLFGQGRVLTSLDNLRNQISRLRVKNLEEYVSQFDKIKQEINGLGRRCVNPRSPVEDENVDEIPEEDWIRLSNGACWDIDTLINYIKHTTNGQNSIQKIKEHMPSYPGMLHIWITNDDYRKIVNHPKAKAAKLARFIKDREFSQYANRISDVTMDTLYNMGSLLWSRGPPFLVAIRQRMTPEQLAVWNRVSSDMTRWDLPDEILFTEPGSIEEEIKYLINGIIKSLANTQLHSYYENLSSDEKAALEIISPNLGEIIRSCHRGDECVMITGEKLIGTYNKMAHAKGRDSVNWIRR